MAQPETLTSWTDPEYPGLSISVREGTSPQLVVYEADGRHEETVLGPREWLSVLHLGLTSRRAAPVANSKGSVFGHWDLPTGMRVRFGAKTLTRQATVDALSQGLVQLLQDWLKEKAEPATRASRAK